jgi:hypothetical protein
MPTTPNDLLTFLRSYVRERAPVVGFHTAVVEVRDGLNQMAIYGTSDRRHAHVHSEDAMRRRSAVANSVGHL